MMQSLDVAVKKGRFPRRTAWHGSLSGAEFPTIAVRHVTLLLAPFFLSSVAVSAQPTKPPLPRDNRGIFERLKHVFGPPIKISLDWTRRARYGLDYDKNENGIPDLPNTPEYVYGRDDCPCRTNDCSKEPARFRVDFDVSKTTWPSISVPPSGTGVVLPKGENIPSSLRGVAPPPGVPTITPDEHRLEHAKFRERMRGYQIEIVSDKIETPIFSATWDQAPTSGQENELGWKQDKTGYRMCLPEGDYDVAVLARDWATGDWSKLTRRITIEDFLIVSLGDSFGSGEGTPEGVIEGKILDQGGGVREEIIRGALIERADEDYRTALWADAGQRPPPFIEVKKTRLLTVPLLGAGPQLITTVATLPNYSAFSEEAKDHRRYHRSSFAPSSQAAIRLQRDSGNKYSVTFVNLAMSGAQTKKGLQLEYSGVQDEAFYNSPPKTQLAELERIIGKGRKIDAIVFSLGGNDAGFANVIAGLVARDEITRWEPDIKTSIAPAVRHGGWVSIRSSISGFYRDAIWEKLDWENRDGLDDLDARYLLITERIKDITAEIQNIFIMEYPNLATGTDRDFCRDILNDWSATLPAGLPIPGTLEVDRDELRWVNGAVLEPLNKALQDSATIIGATYVAGITEDSIGHGLCAPLPYDSLSYSPSHPVPDRLSENFQWYRQRREAIIIGVRRQDQNVLILHPNEFGYLAMAKRLLNVMKVSPVKDEIVESQYGRENVE